jgi:hypothetical protein
MGKFEVQAWFGLLTALLVRSHWDAGRPAVGDNIRAAR